MPNLVEFVFRADNRSTIRALNQIAETSRKTGRQVKRDAEEQTVGFRDMSENASRVRGVIGSLAATIGLGGLGLGLRDSIRAGEAWQSQQAQLQVALRNTGSASKETQAHLLDAAEKLATHGGFDAGQTLQGITQFVRINGNAADAVNKVTLATNIARSSGRDFNQILRALTMAEQGRTTGLARLGVAVPRVTTAETALKNAALGHRDSLLALEGAGVKLTSAEKARLVLSNQITPAMQQQARTQDQLASRQQVFTLLQNRYHGATEAYSKSTQGAIQNARNSIDIALKTSSQRLLPVVAKIATIGASVVLWLVQNKGVLVTLGVLIGGVTAILSAHAVVMEVVKAKNIALMASNRLLGTSFGTVAAEARAASVAEAGAGAAAGTAAEGGLLGRFGGAAGLLRGGAALAGGALAAGALRDATGVGNRKGHHSRAGGIIGSIVGGGAGFLVGGPWGAAGGAALGNIAGGFIGSLYTGGVIGRPKHLYGGGPVGFDSVPLWGSPGEGMVNTRGMNVLGESGLLALNSGMMPGHNQPIILNATLVTKLDGRVLTQSVVRQVLNKAARGPSSLVGGSLVTGAPGLPA